MLIAIFRARDHNSDLPQIEPPLTDTEKDVGKEGRVLESYCRPTVILNHPIRLER